MLLRELAQVWVMLVAEVSNFRWDFYFRCLNGGLFLWGLIQKVSDETLLLMGGGLA